MSLLPCYRGRSKSSPELSVQAFEATKRIRSPEEEEEFYKKIRFSAEEKLTVEERLNAYEDAPLWAKLLFDQIIIVNEDVTGIKKEVKEIKKEVKEIINTKVDDKINHMQKKTNLLEERLHAVVTELENLKIEIEKLKHTKTDQLETAREEIDKFKQYNTTQYNIRNCLVINDTPESSQDDLENSNQFEKSAQHANYSVSVVDIFSLINQSLEILKKLEVPDPVVEAEYLHRFSETVQKVTLQYTESIQVLFVKICHYNTILSVLCILMNNIQQTRVQLQKVYELAGGKKLMPKTTELFNNAQQSLNHCLDELCSIYTRSIGQKIEKCCKDMNSNLMLTRGGVVNLANPNERQQMWKEAENVLHPLMLFMDDNFPSYAKYCDKTVLKKLLKELWKMVLNSIEKAVILPPMTEEFTKEASHNLSQRQCLIMERVLDQITLYFCCDGEGLKKSYLNKSPENQSLKHALLLYSQTTDLLIKNFIQSQTQQNLSYSSDDQVGEVYVQVDLFTYMATGEHKVTVKVVESRNLDWQTSSMFRPFVEVTIVGPHLSDKRRKHSTKSKNNNWCPKYNETMHFQLGNEEELSSYELQISVKDYCFGRKDQLIGTTVLQLKDIIAFNSYASWSVLGRALYLDDTGWTILRILSQRSNDELARDFVALKSDRRGDNFN